MDAKQKGSKGERSPKGLFQNKILRLLSVLGKPKIIIHFTGIRY
jgi:hypothetical protein